MARPWAPPLVPPLFSSSFLQAASRAENDTAAPVMPVRRRNRRRSSRPALSRSSSEGCAGWSATATSLLVPRGWSWCCGRRPWRPAGVGGTEQGAELSHPGAPRPAGELAGAELGRPVQIGSSQAEGGQARRRTDPAGEVGAAGGGVGGAEGGGHAGHLLRH